MSGLCKWLHEQLARLPLMGFPFDLERLPGNGIYFFYEEGEVWGHGGDQLRIVRIGTHTGPGNLRSRISETYLLDERRLNLGPEKAKPADRSVFRKNLGRALLNRDGGDYLQVWEIDFTLRAKRDQVRQLRDVVKERRLEKEISRLLRDRFSFRAIAVDDRTKRTQLEKHLIGAVAGCALCRASHDWLGRRSPQTKIREGNLWQMQNLNADPLGPRDKEAVLRAISATRGWGSD